MVNLIRGSNNANQVLDVKLFKELDDIMNKYRSYVKVKRIVARLIQASVADRDDIKSVPSVKLLEMAEQMLLIRAMADTDPLVKYGRLVGLCPLWRGGLWVTRGRFGKNLSQVLGEEEELPILLNTSRLSHLLMVSALNEDHREAKTTLWRSRAKSWIYRGRSLAARVCSELQVFLSQAAIVVNDRPLGLRSLTKDILVPLTPYQLLIGPTSTANVTYKAEDVENFPLRSNYQEELLNIWGRQWETQVFAHLLPC